MSLVATDRHLGGFHAARDHHTSRLNHSRPHVEGLSAYRSRERTLYATVHDQRFMSPSGKQSDA